MDQYKPVSCNLYDELSNAAVLQQLIVIETTDLQIINGHVSNIYTSEKSEYCVIDDNIVRLDKIAKLTTTDKNGTPIVSLWSNPKSVLR